MSGWPTGKFCITQSHCASDYTLQRFLCVLAVCSSYGLATAAELLDPTRPAGWQAAATDSQQPLPTRPAALQLQGTFSADGEHSAMISGQRLGVGDRVAGAQILDIRTGLVVMEADGEQFELVYGIPAVKMPVARAEENR